MATELPNIVSTAMAAFRMIEEAAAQAGRKRAYPIMRRHTRQQRKELIGRLKSLSEEIVERSNSLLKEERVPDPYTVSPREAILRIADSPETSAHSLSMGMLASSFAAELSRGSPAAQRRLVRDAIYHDIGKAVLPFREVLEFRDFLGPKRPVLGAHAVGGAVILSRANAPYSAIEAAFYHHFPGPDYLSVPGLTPTVSTDLIKALDVFEALRADRGYKESKTLEEIAKIVSGDISKGAMRPDVYLRAFGSPIPGAIEIDPSLFGAGWLGRVFYDPGPKKLYRLTPGSGQGFVELPRHSWLLIPYEAAVQGRFRLGEMDIMPWVRSVSMHGPAPVEEFEKRQLAFIPEIDIPTVGHETLKFLYQSAEELQLRRSELLQLGRFMLRKMQEGWYDPISGQWRHVGTGELSRAMRGIVKILNLPFEPRSRIDRVRNRHYAQEVYQPLVARRREALRRQLERIAASMPPGEDLELFLRSVALDPQRSAGDMRLLRIAFEWYQPMLDPAVITPSPSAEKTWGRSYEFGTAVTGKGIQHQYFYLPPTQEDLVRGLQDWQILELKDYLDATKSVLDRLGISPDLISFSGSFIDEVTLSFVNCVAYPRRSIRHIEALRPITPAGIQHALSRLVNRNPGTVYANLQIAEMLSRSKIAGTKLFTGALDPVQEKIESIIRSMETLIYPLKVIGRSSLSDSATPSIRRKLVNSIIPHEVGHLLHIYASSAASVSAPLEELAAYFLLESSSTSNVSQRQIQLALRAQARQLQTTLLSELVAHTFAMTLSPNSSRDFLSAMEMISVHTDKEHVPGKSLAARIPSKSYIRRGLLDDIEKLVIEHFNRHGDTPIEDYRELPEILRASDVDVNPALRQWLTEPGGAFIYRTYTNAIMLSMYRPELAGNYVTFYPSGNLFVYRDVTQDLLGDNLIEVIDPDLTIPPIDRFFMRDVPYGSFREAQSKALYRFEKLRRERVRAALEKLPEFERWKWWRVYRDIGDYEQAHKYKAQWAKRVNFPLQRQADATRQRAEQIETSMGVRQEGWFGEHVGTGELSKGIRAIIRLLKLPFRNRSRYDPYANVHFALGLYKMGPADRASKLSRQWRVMQEGWFGRHVGVGEKSPAMRRIVRQFRLPYKSRSGFDLLRAILLSHVSPQEVETIIQYATIARLSPGNVPEDLLLSDVEFDGGRQTDLVRLATVPDYREWWYSRTVARVDRIGNYNRMALYLGLGSQVHKVMEASYRPPGLSLDVSHQWIEEKLVEVAKEQIAAYLEPGSSGKRTRSRQIAPGILNPLVRLRLLLRGPRNYLEAMMQSSNIRRDPILQALASLRFLAARGRQIPDIVEGKVIRVRPTSDFLRLLLNVLPEPSIPTKVRHRVQSGFQYAEQTAQELKEPLEQLMSHVRSTISAGGRVHFLGRDADVLFALATELMPSATAAGAIEYLPGLSRKFTENLTESEMRDILLKLGVGPGDLIIDTQGQGSVMARIHEAVGLIDQGISGQLIRTTMLQSGPMAISTGLGRHILLRQPESMTPNELRRAILRLEALYEHRTYATSEEHMLESHHLRVINRASRTTILNKSAEEVWTLHSPSAWYHANWIVRFVDEARKQLGGALKWDVEVDVSSSGVSDEALQTAANIVLKIDRAIEEAGSFDVINEGWFGKHVGTGELSQAVKTVIGWLGLPFRQHSRMRLSAVSRFAENLFRALSPLKDYMPKTVIGKLATLFSGVGIWAILREPERKAKRFEEAWSVLKSHKKTSQLAVLISMADKPSKSRTHSQIRRGTREKLERQLLRQRIQIGRQGDPSRRKIHLRDLLNRWNSRVMDKLADIDHPDTAPADDILFQSSRREPDITYTHSRERADGGTEKRYRPSPQPQRYEASVTVIHNPPSKIRREKTMMRYYQDSVGAAI